MFDPAVFLAFATLGVFLILVGKDLYMGWKK